MQNNNPLQTLDALLGEYVAHLTRSGMPTTAQIVASVARACLKQIEDSHTPLPHPESEK
jgi:hypothetical protein